MELAASLLSVVSNPRRLDALHASRRRRDRHRTKLVSSPALPPCSPHFDILANMLHRLSLPLLVTALLSHALSAAESATSDETTTKSIDRKDSSAAKRPPTRRPPNKSVRQLKAEVERDKWLARLKERGVEPWPENETEKEHAAALKKSREMAHEV